MKRLLVLLLSLPLVTIAYLASSDIVLAGAVEPYPVNCGPGEIKHCPESHYECSNMIGSCYCECVQPGGCGATPPPTLPPTPPPTVPPQSTLPPNDYTPPPSEPTSPPRGTTTPLPTPPPSQCPLPAIVGGTNVSCQETTATCSWNASVDGNYKYQVIESDASPATSNEVPINRRSALSPTRLENSTVGRIIDQGQTTNTSISFPITSGMTYKCIVTTTNSCGESAPSSDQKQCGVKPTPTPTPVPTPTPTPVPTPTPTPSPTPPACNTPCQSSFDCQDNRQGCNLCLPDNNGVKRCVAPTPTPTPPIACNSQCVRNDDCVGDAAKNGCVVCAPDQQGVKRCVVPTPSPTPPIACNSQCVRNDDCVGDAAKNGCVVCAPDQQGVKRCVVPTPSPTPDFNPAMCHCDGIEATEIVPGKEATFTAYSKVEGADLTKAVTKDISFFLGEGDSQSATIIAKSGPIAVDVVEERTGLRRYRARWTVKIPDTLKAGSTYRVWVQINCVQATPAPTSQAQGQSLLGASTEKAQFSFFDSIRNFFARLFGGNRASQATPAAVSPNPSSADLLLPSPSTKQLKLDTIHFKNPSKILEKSCTQIRFKVI